MTNKAQNLTVADFAGPSQMNGKYMVKLQLPCGTAFLASALCGFHQHLPGRFRKLFGFISTFGGKAFRAHRDKIASLRAIDRCQIAPAKFLLADGAGASSHSSSQSFAAMAAKPGLCPGRSTPVVSSKGLSALLAVLYLGRLKFGTPTAAEGGSRVLGHKLNVTLGTDLGTV